LASKAGKVIDWGRSTQLDASGEPTHIIATSQGLPGGGKSHFWMTAPGPIAWFLFDPNGLEGLRANPLFESKEVHVFDYCGELNIGKLPDEERMAAALAAMANFQKDWDIAIAAGARTLVIDKETMLWEMLRYAHDEVSSPTPKNFHELNLMYRGWIQDATVNKRNLGFIRDVRETWGIIGRSKEGKPQQGFTGKYKPEGQKYLTGNVQLSMEHRWNAEAREFETEILDKCRLGEAKLLMGKVVPEMDFPTLAMMLYPESDEETWS
jgi:hypothetical protein